MRVCMSSVSCITSERDVYLNVLNTLSVVADNVKKIEKAGKRCFSAAFERAFQLSGGPYIRVEPPSPVSSDEELSSCSDGSGDERDAVASPTATDTATKRSAYLAAVMHLLTAVTQQLELTAQMRGLAKVPAAIDAARKACELQPTVLQACFDYVESAAAAKFDVPADSSLVARVREASEVERRTRGLLSWAKLKKIGGVDVVAAEDAGSAGAAGGVNETPATLVAPASSAEVASRPAITSAARQLQPEPHQPSTQLHRMQQAPPPPPPATAAALPHPRSTLGAPSPHSYANVHEEDEDDDGSSFVGTMDATDLLNDVAEQLTFDTSAMEKKPAATASAELDEMFRQETEQGRRNYRARELLSLHLEQTNEPLTPARQKIVSQCPTLRDVMSVLGKLDYNIITFQVRSMPQQIGESGPVLWCAALDLCVSENYEDAENARKKWMEERVGAAPLEPCERERYRWVELVRSEACVRGAQAKLKVVTLAAELLFPNELAYYCSLGRDDVFVPDASVRGRGAGERLVAKTTAFGGMVSFNADRATSFVRQAFQIMERQAPQLGRMTLDIAEERGTQNQTEVPSQLENYTVRIYRGDGTLVTAQSSATYQGQFEEGTTAKTAAPTYKSLEVISNATPTSPAMLPTLFDALHTAAEKLGVLGDYLLLKASYDNLRLPVANEPREYVLNYVSLVFGTFRMNGTVHKDMVDTVEQPLGAGWSTTIRIGVPRTPTDDASEMKFVQLEHRRASTKKAARNEALLYAGKTNFTPELLSMMEYGTVPQKAHAEIILVVDTTPAVCLHHPLLKEMSTWKKSVALAQEESSAPGAALHAETKEGQAHSNPCDHFIVSAIRRNLPVAVNDMTAWLAQSNSEFIYTLTMDTEKVEWFLASLPQVESVFGQYTYPDQEMPNSKRLTGSTAFIGGRSPIFALYIATRSLREILENYSSSSRASAKYANAVGTARSTAPTVTA